MDITQVYYKSDKKKLQDLKNIRMCVLNMYVMFRAGCEVTNNLLTSEC